MRVCVCVCARDKCSTHLCPVTTGKTEWNAGCLLLLISVKGSLGVTGFGCMLPPSDADFRLSESEVLGSEATNLCFDVPHLEV